ncbi:hypothetical protein L1987_80732 [Smallanthus sonchifolius]|uniref:Uncharacterized protein n=1 Tax=Smallanthus sonchifolius TaxID=185202 RepID=A0ACB8YP41_9ASTR|nr:hypothetical protein L1987_80732 [Smallanthus sonchifolius]
MPTFSVILLWHYRGAALPLHRKGFSILLAVDGKIYYFAPTEKQKRKLQLIKDERLKMKNEEARTDVEKKMRRKQRLGEEPSKLENEEARTDVEKKMRRKQRLGEAHQSFFRVGLLQESDSESRPPLVVYQQRNRQRFALQLARLLRPEDTYHWRFIPEMIQKLALQEGISFASRPDEAPRSQELPLLGVPLDRVLSTLICRLEKNGLPYGVLQDEVY